MADKLGVADRIALLSVLTDPDTAEMVEAFQSIRSKVDFSDKEIEKYGLVADGDSYTWDGTGDKKRKEIPFSKVEKQAIVKRLFYLSESRKMKQEWLGIYKRFALGEPDAEETDN